MSAEHQRCCSNPKCRRPVHAAFSFVKAGDLIELWGGKREPKDVRELCGRCGSRRDLMEGEKEEVEAFFREIGWLDNERTA